MADAVGALRKDVFIEQTRGIAILLVLIYHYTNRIPYWIMGSEKAPIVEFFSGKIGVYMFFIISGLLIAKTLEGCATLGEFYAKRISRIWPLFIAANIVIFAWLRFFDAPTLMQGPKGFDVTGRTFADLIGSSLFLGDFSFKWMDGVFWSILVELKYYALIGFIAFIFKRNYVRVFAIIAAALSLADFLFLLLLGNGHYTIWNNVLHGALIAQYLPFFAVGMMLYKRAYDIPFVICCVLCAAQVIEASSLNPDFTSAGTIKFLVIFSLVLAFDYLVARGRICSTIGKYSYSIYLFHQAIGLSLILMLTPRIGIDMAILSAFAFVLCLSVLASWLVEWRYRKRLTALLIAMGGYVGLGNLKLSSGKNESAYI